MRCQLTSLVAVVLLLVTAACAPRREPVKGQGLVVLEGATLITGAGGGPVEHSVVILEGERIKRIGRLGSFRYPADAEVMDLRDRWLVPGFVEMHSHIPGPPDQEQILRTYLAFGVTTLMNPMAVPETGTEPRTAVATGRLIGPRIFTAGRGLNGPSAFDGFSLMVRVNSEADARAEVQRQAAAGVDFIKVFAHMEPAVVAAVVREAHAQGLKVTGHLGRTSWQEGIDCGIDVLLHSALGGPTWELVPEPERNRFRINVLPPQSGIDEYDASLFREWRELVDLQGPLFQNLVAAIVESNVTVDPNLVVYESIIWGDDTEARERLEPDMAPLSDAEAWRSSDTNPATSGWDEEDFAEAKATWPLFLDMVRMFHEAGVRLTAGSDLINPWITPGVAWHRELELLVSAGISPREVLSIATRNGAEALGALAEIGTVEEGKIADLVVLGADPLEDIRNTRRILLVFQRGIHYDPDRLLSR